MSICLVRLPKYGAWVNIARHLVLKREDIHPFIKWCILGKKKKTHQFLILIWAIMWTTTNLSLIRAAHEFSQAELTSFNIRASICVHETLHLIFKSSTWQVYVSGALAHSRAACSLNTPTGGSNQCNRRKSNSRFQHLPPWVWGEMLEYIVRFNIMRIYLYWL